MSDAKRVLVLAATASLTAHLDDVAQKLALELALGCSGDSGTLRLNFATRDSALHIVEYVHLNPVAAIIPVGDETVPSAARAASMIGTPFHPPKAADACADKKLLHRKLTAAGIITSEGGTITLECVMAKGKLRILAAVKEGHAATLTALAPEDQKRAVAVLKKLLAVLKLKHGPVRVILSDEFAVADVSLCCPPSAFTGALHFRIPLVDQDISYEEIIIRNALDLDVNRILLTPQSDPGHSRSNVFFPE